MQYSPNLEKETANAAASLQVLHIKVSRCGIAWDVLHHDTRSLQYLDESRKHVKALGTPETLGSREDKALGLIGDCCFGAEEELLGNQQRLYARRELLTPGEKF